MSRLAPCFKNLKKHNKTAFIPFITAGDPHPKHTVALMHKLVESGSDIIELGVPFSDPMADGPVIQAADERALEHNVSLNDVLAMVKQFRQKDKSTPVVLMGYLNPIEIMGYGIFAKNAQAAGVDGVLVVDLPPEEGGEFIRLTRHHKIDVIFLISPTTSTERIKLIAQSASGYLYYVSLNGVTGAKTLLDIAAVKTKLNEIRAITNLPLGVGFGIKDGDTAQAIAKIADAVVVGSVLVDKIAAAPNNAEKFNRDIGDVIADMRTKMHRISGGVFR